MQTVKASIKFSNSVEEAFLWGWVLNRQRLVARFKLCFEEERFMQKLTGNTINDAETVTKYVKQ